ncbi:MAG: heptosyltransferase [Pyrinomonadaceae bacterium]|nr:heptosyltransferase [Pyrinomonadaceae bacterium]
MHSLRGEDRGPQPGSPAGVADSPQPLAPARWDWKKVERVLIVRLRSIGDTVLSTPSLTALKRFLPHAEIDILLEDWVAPLLEGSPYVDNIITMERGSVASRARVAARLRTRRYDVVYNLHGGTTATLLTRATGATHRVGYEAYQYSWLHNHRSPSSSFLWKRDKTHSVEQQLALLGWTGVPVSDRPPTHLAVTEAADAKIAERLRAQGIGAAPFVVIHPAAASDTKQWAATNFARVADALTDQGLAIVAISAPDQLPVIEALKKDSTAAILPLTNLSLPEVTALLARARLFVGNDSGIAHMAAAVETPAVVIFGSSNTAHWQPWASAAAEFVLEEMDCQPCHGYFCEKFEQPECIKRVPVERVMAAVERVLRESA